MLKIKKIKHISIFLPQIVIFVVLILNIIAIIPYLRRVINSVKGKYYEQKEVYDYLSWKSKNGMLPLAERHIKKQCDIALFCFTTGKRYSEEQKVMELRYHLYPCRFFLNCPPLRSVEYVIAEKGYMRSNEHIDGLKNIERDYKLIDSNGNYDIYRRCFSEVENGGIQK